MDDTIKWLYKVYLVLPKYQTELIATYMSRVKNLTGIKIREYKMNAKITKYIEFRGQK